VAGPVISFIQVGDKKYKMEITELFDLIKSKLTEHGYVTESEGLSEMLASASTGGEALMSTGKYLYDLRSNNYEAFIAVKALIEQYLNYCRLNGFIIQ
jgi:hypothetical protein